MIRLYSKTQICSFSAYLKKFFERLSAFYVSKNTFLEPKTNPKLLLPKSPENCPKIIMFGHDFSHAVDMRFTYGRLRV